MIKSTDGGIVLERDRLDCLNHIGSIRLVQPDWLHCGAQVLTALHLVLAKMASEPAVQDTMLSRCAA